MSQMHSSNWSETAANNNAAPPNGFPENQLPSSLNDGMREFMAALKLDWNLTHAVYTSGGSGSAYTITPTYALTAYTGCKVAFVVHAANTSTTPTLNISGLGAKTIKRIDGAALAVGDMPINSIAIMGYDGTDFRLFSPPATVQLQSYSIITSNTTAVAGTRYLCDTSGGAFTLTLPASPTDGDWIDVAKGGASTLTIARNGNSIAGQSTEDLLVLSFNFVGRLVYDASAGGWLY